MCNLLLQGLSCKNKKTRVVCIEEIQATIEVGGAVALGRSGVKDIAVYLDSKDNDVNGRSACLELCNALYLSLGAELPKLMKLMGTSVSERTTSMIEDRIRQKNKQAGGVSAALAAFASLGTRSTSAPSAGSALPSHAPSGISMRAGQGQGRVEDSEDVDYASPRRNSRESYESSPSPFRLEITPPATITEEQRAKVRDTRLPLPYPSSPFLEFSNFPPRIHFFYLSILSFFSSSLFSPYFISHCFPYLYSVTTLLLSLFLLTLFLFTTLFLRHAPSHYVPSPLSFKMFSAASPRALTNVMNTETFAREVRTMPSH